MIARTILAALTLTLVVLPVTAARAEPATAKAQVVSLPRPDLAGKVTLEKAVASRRSVREYAPGPLTLAEVSQLMWAAQGITGADDRRRAVPSARAVHPLEVRLEARRVEGLAPGLYAYRPKEHVLALIAPGDHSGAVKASAGQPSVEAAAAVLCVTGDSALAAAKFRGNAERWLGMEAGFVVQNVYLQCTALGLGTVMVGGYDEPKANAAFQLAPGWKTLGLLPVGRRK